PRRAGWGVAPGGPFRESGSRGSRAFSAPPGPIGTGPPPPPPVARGKREPEPQPAERARARDERPAVGVDDRLHDREPQPRPAAGATPRRVDAEEALREARQLFLGNTRARVLPVDHGASALAPQRDHEAPPPVGVAQRVLQH